MKDTVDGGVSLLVLLELVEGKEDPEKGGNPVIYSTTTERQGFKLNNETHKT